MEGERGFVHIILIIVVVVAVIAVILFLGKDKLSSIIQIGSPMPTATTSNTVNGWKTYTSKSGNTTVSYPADWGYREFGSGVAFYPLSAGDIPGSEPIVMSELNKILNDVDLPFSEYVKVAASHEIQNYESLSTISSVTATSGIVGYTTTWKVSPLPGSGGNGLSESLPITYFPIPDVKTSDIQISLGDEKYLNIYNEMVKTVRLKKASQTTAPTNLTTYTNSQYHFEIEFPNNYKALTDSDNLSGWPNAVALIYKGGQSYDLPIEVWNSEGDYQAKYTDPSLNIAVHKTSDGKFITLVNANKDSEVDQIIASFKFTK